MMKLSTTAEGKEKTGSSKQSSGPNSSKKARGLDELPEGLMGKMLKTIEWSKLFFGMVTLLCMLLNLVRIIKTFLR